MKEIINASQVDGIVTQPMLNENLKHYMTILDQEWGEEREHKVCGGYAVIIESPVDYEELEKMYIDITEDIAEVVYHITEETGEEYYLVLFILNPDFHIICIIPDEYAHRNISSQVTDIVKPK